MFTTTKELLSKRYSDEEMDPGAAKGPTGRAKRENKLAGARRLGWSVLPSGRSYILRMRSDGAYSTTSSTDKLHDVGGVERSLAASGPHAINVDVDA